MSSFQPHVWRAATRIVAALVRCYSAENPLPVPERSWQLLTDLLQRRERARRKGWTLAAEQLRGLLVRQTGWLQQELQFLGDELRQAGPPACPLTVAAVYQDLVALGEEFAAMKVDLAAGTLTLTTADIVLHDLWLGPFDLVWNWSQLGTWQELQVVAREPQTPAGRSDVTHPHVLDHVLCEGEAAPALQAALRSGRLLDHFVIVQQVLQTYNAGSAYVTTDDWSGSRCADCDDRIRDHARFPCSRCGDDLCHDCRTVCAQCEENSCSSCLRRCSAAMTGGVQPAGRLPPVRHINSARSVKTSCP